MGEKLGGTGPPRHSPCYGPDTVKSYASDELAYLEEAKTKITVLHEELQSVCSKLTNVHISMLKRFPLYVQNVLTSRRKKENRKVRKNKEEQFKQRARSLLGNLSSVEVATQIFDSIQRNNYLTAVERINADNTKKLAFKAAARRSFAVAASKKCFSTTSTKRLERVAAILNAQNQESAMQVPCQRHRR